MNYILVDLIKVRMFRVIVNDFFNVNIGKNCFLVNFNLLKN